MYIIRERFFGFGQDSDITDEHGRPVLRVDGKALSLTPEANVAVCARLIQASPSGPRSPSGKPA